MSEDNDDNDAPERSFRNSHEYHFMGRKLEPFSFLRQTALLGMMDHIGTTSLAEVAVALWLMHQPDSVVHRARRKPAEFVDQVDQFAEEQGIVFNGVGLAAATEVYQSLTSDVRDSSAAPDLPKNGGGDPN